MTSTLGQKQPKFSVFALLLVACPLSVAAQSYLPDHARTPGALDAQVTQGNVHGTVCARGYTKTVRPPKQYTNRLKKKQMRALGLPGSMHDYEEDHLVPLCAGGAPHDARNLWPEPRHGQWSAAAKDELEASVCRQLCRGDITLRDAQAIFLEPDWTKAYMRYFGTR